VEDLRGDIIVVAKEREEQVFGPDDVRFIEFGFEVGNFKDFFRLFGERNISDSEGAAGSPDGIFDSFLQFVQVDAEITEDFYRYSFAFADDAEQEMFGSDIVMTEP
jgi:hypothetical protein